jgi:hypothetical protein
MVSDQVASSASTRAPRGAMAEKAIEEELARA